MTLDDLLTLSEAAELVDRTKGHLAVQVKRGSLAVSVRHGERVVAVRELVRVGWLESSGRRWELPEKLGLPLLVPLDPEQMLTKREVSDLVGAPFNTVALWVQQGKLESTLVCGWPSGGKGMRERRLISVGELVAKGWLTAQGEPARLSRKDRRAGAVREPEVVPWRPKRVVRQRSIPKDLPTNLTDERIGISDPEMALLVLVALSRFLAADGSRRGDGAYRALRLLRLYAHTEVVRAGVVSAAPCPDVDPELPIPTGRTIAEHLGLPARYRAEEWARLTDADCVAAHFDCQLRGALCAAGVVAGVRGGGAGWSGARERTARANHLRRVPPAARGALEGARGGRDDGSCKFAGIRQHVPQVLRRRAGADALGWVSVVAA
jgi:hypothetical protein